MSLDSAKAKLRGHILIENLPTDRNDNLWGEIRHECGLNLDELAALKKAFCSFHDVHSGHHVPGAVKHPELLPSPSDEEDKVDYLVQFKVYHINSSHNILKNAKGFRRYVQSVCVSLGVHGSVWRVPNVHARILASSTRAQLHTLLDFLRDMQETGLIGFFEVERPERGVFSRSFHVRPSESRYVETGEFSDHDLDDVAVSASEHADVAILKGL
eukprot:gene32734-39573_t